MFSINYATVIDPILRGIRRYLPDFPGMKAGDSVLDVCCGSGAQVYEYTLKGLAATGLDGNQEMLVLAQRYYDKGGMAGASFKLADAARLPFSDGAFDFASISLALHEKKETLVDAVLVEMKRVTRREGALVFADFSVPLPITSVGYSIRVIEFMAGRDHFTSFRRYLKTGGLHSILKQGGLAAEQEERVKSGGVTLILARNA